MTRERESDASVVHHGRCLLARSSNASVPFATRPETITAAGHFDSDAPAIRVASSEKLRLSQRKSVPDASPADTPNGHSRSSAAHASRPSLSEDQSAASGRA